MKYFLNAQFPQNKLWIKGREKFNKSFKTCKTKHLVEHMCEETITECLFKAKNKINGSNLECSFCK